MTMKIKFSFVLVLMLLSISAIVVQRAGARAQTDGGGPLMNLTEDWVPEPQVSDRELKLAELRKRIEGQEAKPSGEVFKNIKNFKALPAGRLPLVMNAFSRALGVGCDHCHLADKWESEDKPQKEIAREMMKMAGTINGDLLKNIKNLKSAQPEISCSTCHRGQVIPDKKLPGS